MTKKVEIVKNDEMFISPEGLRTITTIPIGKLKPNSPLPYGLKLVRKVPRYNWWEFWKPKYIGVILKRNTEVYYVQRW